MATKSSTVSSVWNSERVSRSLLLKASKAARATFNGVWVRDGVGAWVAMVLPLLVGFRLNVRRASPAPSICHRGVRYRPGPLLSESGVRRLRAGAWPVATVTAQNAVLPGSPTVVTGCRERARTGVPLLKWQ